jgi:hypothetical protein
VALPMAAVLGTRHVHATRWAITGLGPSACFLPFAYRTLSEHFLGPRDTVALRCCRPPWMTWRGSEVIVTPTECAFAVVAANPHKPHKPHKTAPNTTTGFISVGRYAPTPFGPTAL